MNADIVELEVSVHHRVAKLLPWAVLGTLPAAERRLVDEHLAVCAECRAELEWERKLQAVQPAAGATPDMEAALASLAPRLESEPRRQAGGARWMQWALAAQLLVIAGLGGQLLRQHDDYRLLGGAAAGAGNLVVVFRPETSERQLRTILQDNGARVVGGPTVTNAWVLEVPPAHLGSAVTRLRGEAAVQLAEPLAPDGPR